MQDHQPSTESTGNGTARETENRSAVAELDTASATRYVCQSYDLLFDFRVHFEAGLGSMLTTRSRPTS